MGNAQYNPGEKGCLHLGVPSFIKGGFLIQSAHSDSAAVPKP